MREIYEQFNAYFEEENKEKAVAYILQLLQDKKIDVLKLYNEILTPAQYDITCKVSDKRICIWKEHVKTAIIRTIVECCYPYVIEMRNEQAEKKELTAVVLCPPEEYHDLGARMVSDFFTICGCESIFVGSNTPYKDFYNAVDVIRPDIIAISVSDYYNLVVTKKMIDDLRKIVTYPVKIVVGGYAFHEDCEKYKVVGADCYARSFDDIKRIVTETQP